MSTCRHPRWRRSPKAFLAQTIYAFLALSDENGFRAIPVYELWQIALTVILRVLPSGVRKRFTRR
jgi:hypothetical protein